MLKAVWIRSVFSITTLVIASSSQARDFPRNDIQAVSAANLAKEICSAAFLSNFDPEQVLATNSRFWLRPTDRLLVRRPQLDREKRTFSIEVGDATGRAVFLGARGCVALGPDGARPILKYTPLKPAKLNNKAPWPVGDVVETADLPPKLDKVILNSAMEAAFADDAYTASFIILYRGKIIAERYAPGIDATTRLPGWSMAKTAQAILVGLLERDGRMALRVPVKIAAWSDPADPRRKTTLANLLRMSAPISCGNDKSWHDHALWSANGYPESFYVFSGPDDSYAYSINRPPLAAGETLGAYTNCQPMIVGQLLMQELANTNDTIDSFANERLTKPLGMNPLVFEPDRAGNPLTAGYTYATTRDWARLGLLLAQDGVWNQKRMLSPQFMALVRSPAPHWKKPIYGGQVWLNAETCLFSQCDLYQMNGIEGQRILIFPSLDLVIVRMGFGAGDVPNADAALRRPAIAALNSATEQIVKAVASKKPSEERTVEATLEGFFTALGNSDRAELDKLLADDFRLFEDGEIWDADLLFDKITANPEREERWTLTQRRVEVSGNLATVDYRNTAAFTQPEKREVYEWTESAVFNRTQNMWKLSFLHSTRIDPITD